MHRSENQGRCCLSDGRGTEQPLLSNSTGLLFNEDLLFFISATLQTVLWLNAACTSYVTVHWKKGRTLTHCYCLSVGIKVLNSAGLRLCLLLSLWIRAATKKRCCGCRLCFIPRTTLTCIILLRPYFNDSCRALDLVLSRSNGLVYCLPSSAPMKRKSR